MRWVFRIVLLALAATATVAAWPLADRRLAIAGAPAIASSVPQSALVTTAAPTGAVIIPVAGIKGADLKSTFNDARTGHVHHALDILAPRGTPVIAAVDGTIRKLFFSRSGGITIYEFDRGEALVYYYAHLDRYADGLHEGMEVRQGDVIGYVGTTGNAPPGTPHLHFAIARLTAEKKWWGWDDQVIDPYPILVTAQRR